MLNRLLRGALIALCATLTSAPAVARQAPQPAKLEEPNEVEAVVVVARRAGVPVWWVSQGPATMVLIGHIDNVPAGAAWSPAELDRAVGMSRKVILPAQARVTPADFGRALFRHRSILGLPKGKTLHDYVSPELAERLKALHGRGLLEDDYLTTHPQSVASQLHRSVGARDRDGPDAASVARGSARSRKVPTRPISVVGAGGLIDTFLEAGPAAYVRCLERAADLAEGGRGPVRQRVEHWTRSRVPEAMASPVEPALGSCSAVKPELARALREEWRQALAQELNTPGVSLAVVPLRYLAERDGLLDQLLAQGLEVQGPRWRRD